ncbi:MAG: sigma 54-interacting transcriptional regulator [Candidatus Latescibacterota bacterium]|nr:MAG: sigma 54-interacting transcriptional regulator [Candidatus Latescibacterota bacterium]
MSNARDDKDGLHNNKRRKHPESVFSPNEEIGQMHFATENYSAAIEYFTKALQSNDLNDFPDRFRLFLRIGDCHRKKGSYKDAWKLLEKARTLLGDDVPTEALGKVDFREAYILYAQGHYENALKIGFSAYRRLKHSDEHREVADVQLLLANCYHRLGQTGEAEEFFTDALSSYRRIEDRIGIAYVYNNLGLLHKNACRWNRSLASLSKSLELAKSLGLTQHLIRVQLNLGVVYAKLRRFTDALSAFSSAATMAERLGDQDKLTKAILMQGRTYVQCGEYCKAEKLILRGQAMANDFGYGRESALADEYLGELMIARGMVKPALVNLNNALRKARQIAPEGDITAEIMRRMADVHFALNNVDKTLAIVNEGLEVAKNCGEFYEMGYFYRTQGLCYIRKGEVDRAAKCLETSVEMFEKYGNPYEQLHSQQRLGRIYLRKRNQESALKAKKIFTDTVVGFGKLEEAKDQILSQVLLAAVEERLGNLDDALLAVYEATRLADEERNTKFQNLLRLMRSRVEGQMARDTRRILEEIPMFGDIQSGSRSRDRLVSGLAASLKLIVGKLNAHRGFVAIPGNKGSGVGLVSLEGMGRGDAKAILSWYQHHSKSENSHGLLITEADNEPELRVIQDRVKVEMGTLVFQELGFENEDLGVIFVHQDKQEDRGPIGQEALHFLGAYARLVSLSIYELIRNERRRVPKAKPAASGFESILTENNEMIKLLNLSERVAHSNATVLLQGETGTGKGLIAYAIHLLSDRRDRRFVHVNCAAMPESLLESELFGHVKGAFTGAVADKDGLLRRADGGTIFLDEIGKTTLAMQGKLLQFLDTEKIRKVGSNDLEPVNVRVICASKVDLMNQCHEGRFLEDFYYRINDFPLKIPPLRRRKEDIALLFFHYLRKYSSEMNKVITDVNDIAMDLLRTYHWPGNVRELEKIVKRAVILADDGEELTATHLPAEVVHAARETGGNGNRKNGLRGQIEALEKREILSSLERNGWNKSQAAIELGISYPSLLSKIKRYNLRVY